MQMLTRGGTYLRGRRAAFALAGALAGAAALSAPALAAGGPPIHRIYDCYGYATSVTNYVSALELQSRSVYVVAPMRQGNHLTGKAVKGTYRLRGSRLTFLTGPYGRIHWSGQWVLKRVTEDGDAAHIGLISPKTHQTVLECYPH